MPKKKRHHDAPPVELISTAQAAEILQRHVRTIHRFVEEGTLKPAGKVPGRTGAYLFRRSDVEALRDRDVA